MDFMYAAQADKHAAYNQTPHSNERGLDRLLGAEDQPLDRPGQKMEDGRRWRRRRPWPGKPEKRGKKSWEQFKFIFIFICYFLLYMWT